MGADAGHGLGFFFFNDTATTEIYTLSLHDALPICQVNSQVEFEDIGIELTVTPNINPDGFVYMEVQSVISALTSSTLDIGNGVLAPIFTNREAQTTVVAKDGETIVIGGLITTTDNESESKVPILGDIPGLGVLFRTTTRTKNRTELLIALRSEERRVGKECRSRWAP